MPLPYHLIDGYNLLHAAGLARATYGPGDLERARTGLLVRLADGLDDSERGRTTVVFDAADPPPDADRSFRFREMTVLFAVAEGEADTLIEDLIRRHPSPRQLRVVSDDLRLQKAAKRRGAQAVKSEALLRRLGRRGSPAEAGSTGGLPAAEAAPVTEWIEFFGLKDGELAVVEPQASVGNTDDREVPAEAEGRAAPPAKGGSRRPVRPKTPGTPARPSSPPPDDEPSGEEFGFWQRRIDELLREGHLPGEEERRPGAG